MLRYGIITLFAFSLHLIQAQEVSIQVQIDSLLSEYQQSDAPGIVVGVTEKGSTQYLKGHGIANLETGQALTPTSVFDIASLAKQFTGIAIAILAENGSLSLEEPITRYLDDLPDFCKNITVTQLLNHTSGIRDWPGLLILGGLRLEDSITLEDIHTLVKNQQALNFQPDQESLYSNTGYNLLALIIEKITGHSFSDWTTQHLFTPLGMNDSFFHDTHGRVIQGLARSYAISDNRNWKEVGNQLTAIGSSSLYATMEDLLKWIHHFEKPSLVEKGDYYDQFLRKNPEETSDSGYHWGLLIGTYKGERQFQHSGAWAGFRTQLIYLPERQLGVVALSNRHGTDIESISYKILDLFSQPSQAKDGAATEASTSNTSTNQEDTLVWTGHYQTADKSAQNIQVSSDEGTFRIQIENQESIPLLPFKKNQYHNKDTDLSVTFSTEHIGWPRKLKITSPSLDIAATETIEWRQGDKTGYEGDYYSNELKTEYKLSVTKIGLTASHHRHAPIHLAPTGKDRFVSKTWFWKQAEFKRNPENEIIGLEITQSRNRGILFSKRIPSPSSID